MIKWKNFDRWAKSRGYTFTMQGTWDEAIEGVNGVPITTGRHNNPDGVPDRVLREIAFRLGLTKQQLEDQI